MTWPVSVAGAALGGLGGILVWRFDGSPVACSLVGLLCGSFVGLVGGWFRRRDLQRIRQEITAEVDRRRDFNDRKKGD